MKKQVIVGWVLLLLTLILGGVFLASDMLFFRLIMGLALGYILARSYMGFAGSVNRAYRTGSTKLMRALMLMFFVTAVLNAGLFLFDGLGAYNLWVNPINVGLILGGLLFGFGMSLSVCCASGVLTDLVTGFPRAIITLFFFMFGVFIGFPVQKTAGWVRKSWFTTKTGLVMDSGQGVYLPDLFGGQTVWAYLLAIAVTGIFCLVVVYLSYRYENKRKSSSTYTPIITEEVVVETHDTSKEYKLFTKETYERLFVKSWPLSVGVLSIAIVVTIMMAVTKNGWGASTPYGWWFGKLLTFFGVSADSLAEFTHVPAVKYTQKFFSHPINVQNFAIILGTLLFMLQSGRFTDSWKATFKITWKEALFFALGGVAMGFGTRLANGCNVGALYTPIVNFSLSGWIFLIFMVVGALFGNMLSKKSNHCPR